MPPKVMYNRDKEIGCFRWSSELFDKKIDSSAGADACHVWTGTTGPAGPLFGVRLIMPDGTDIARMTQSRRILYAQHTGRLLPPMTAVYHACGNRECMNFNHLTLKRPKPTGKIYIAYTPKPRQKSGPKPGSKRTPKPKPGDAN